MAVPEAVSRTYKQLKLEYPFYIVLSKINGRYYVYRSHSMWDKELKKVHTKQEYLGRITEKGEFIKKARVATVPQVPQSTQIEYKLSETDDKILTYLSMNCRIPIVDMAERLGIGVDTILRRKADLEKRFGIRYFASINHLKLGYSTYFVFVSFKDGRPPVEKLKEIFDGKPRIQLAMLTQGKYDLVLFVLVENGDVLTRLIYDIRKDDRLKSYESIWEATTFDELYGYVPLRDKFFELLEKKVWHRTKENPRPSSDNLSQREYTMLRDLNKNGAATFKSIEEKYNFGQGSGRYTFDKLREKELLWRSTLTFQNYNIKYTAIMLMTVTNQESFLKSRQKFFHYVLKNYNAPSSRFSLEGDILTPNGIMLILPILKDGELETELEWLKQNMQGAKIDSLIITQIFVGELCYRRFDNGYSAQADALISEYNEESSKKIDYGST